MSQSPRMELAGILFQEIADYFPEISKGISCLNTSSADIEALSEVHRLFHNIKGASSQVAFAALSQSAALGEGLLSELIESNQNPSPEHLIFLEKLNRKINDFCVRENKTTQSELELLKNSVTTFNALVAQSLFDFDITLPENVQIILQQNESNAQDSDTLKPSNKPDIQSLRGECLESLHSISPLLNELITGSIDQGIKKLPGTVLQPMTASLSTLAYCSRSAGLTSQETLYKNLIDILSNLQRNTTLIEKSTLELLQDFLSYLELILSLPAGKSDIVAETVQIQLSNVVDLLHVKAHEEPSIPVSQFIEQPTSSFEIEIPEDFADTDLFSFDDPELLDIFKSECAEHIQEINKHLELVADLSDSQTVITGDVRSLLSHIRISTHTLKGAAAMTGFSHIAKYAFELEKLLDWLHDEAKLLSIEDVPIIRDAVTHLEALSVDPAKPISISTSLSLDGYLQSRQSLENSPAEPLRYKKTQTQELEDLLLHDLNSSSNFSNIDLKDQELHHDSAYSDNLFEDIDNSEVAYSQNSAGALESEEIAHSIPQLSQDEIELHDIFQTECDEHLLVITAELNKLVDKVINIQQVTPEIRKNIGQMRRAVHTLKGAAAMTGFGELASLTHSLEDLLDVLHDNSTTISPADVSVIAEAIDTTELIAQTPGTLFKHKVERLTEDIQRHLAERAFPEEDAAVSVAEVEKPSFQLVPDNLLDDDAVLATDPSNIRVPLKDLEELVNIEGELVVTRGSMEKLLEKFSKSIEELNSIKDTLRRKSQELEVGFEAQSLYGFGPATPIGSEDNAEDTEASEFDPIELDRYSQLNLIIRSLNEISIDVNAIHSDMTALESNMEGQVAKQQLSMGLMQEKLMRIRMTPLSSISRSLFRTVRQTAKQLEKDVQLKIVGEDVLMDRFIWSKTMDPLMHILRNAIDHGIEGNDERKEKNKPETSVITLDANQRGRNVVIKISDDGRGIHTDLLKEKLINEGTLPPDTAIKDRDLLPYLFRPSISTRDDVSQVSGRGVGLDVVLRNIQELRGRVQIQNHPGEGVTFELSIPTTLSVNRAVIINLDEKHFAVPIQDITEVRKFKPDQVIHAEEQPQVKWSDKQIPLIELAPYLQLPGEDTRFAADDILTLIIHNGEEHVAMQINNIEEQREIIIKDLGTHLRYVKGISGVTLTGEGFIIPVLNLSELVLTNQPLVSSTVVEAQIEKVQEPLKVLVVDDSISVRYSLTRLINGQSWQPYQAVDGIDALEKLETLTPDLIILDIEMPRMNGYEFMSILRRQEKGRDLPVVMLTSRASEKHKKKAEELGVNHYMTKPFQEDDFVQLIKSIEANR